MKVKDCFSHVYACLLVIISLLLLVPSFVPGAMSVLAFYSSIFVLALSILTVKRGRSWCFNMTALSVTIGTLFINDFLRLFESIPTASWTSKGILYAVLAVTILTGIRRVQRYVEPTS